MVSKIFNTAILPRDAVEAAVLTIAPGDDPAKAYGLRLIEQVRSRNSYLAAMLISHGADVNTQDEDGMTALHHAAAYDVHGCIRVLVGCGKCDYLIKDNQGRYASDLAIEWARDYAVARLLTKHQIRQAYEQGVPAYVKN